MIYGKQKHLRYKKVVWPRETAVTKGNISECVAMHGLCKNNINLNQIYNEPEVGIKVCKLTFSRKILPFVSKVNLYSFLNSLF